MQIQQLETLLAQNPYPGRGIVVGTSKDGEKAYVAYFLTGRSANSRNRVIKARGKDIITAPYDESKVEDPSLIIYAAIRPHGSDLIVTNGDQTDTIYDGLERGHSFREALMTREFEPDAPNFTPRISALLHLADAFSFEMSILKAANEEGSACHRYHFEYASLPGEGRFIHTYEGNGNPLPTFEGEPRRVVLPDTLEALGEMIWNSLDKENRISLYVKEIKLATKEEKEVYFNSNLD